MNVLAFEKQVAVIGALCEGLSIRSVERLTGVHRDTVMRLGARIGAGCAIIHDVTMRGQRTGQIQIDELWAYIGKKQRRLKPTDAPEMGDCYTFIALDALGKAILSYRTGKRDGDTAREFLTDLRARGIGAPVLSSDAFAPYQNLVGEVFGDEVHYGQIVKRFVGEPHRDAARRYSPGVVVAVDRTVLIGEPPEHLIGTSHIERLNLTVRMRQRRFTRLTNAYSKKIENHAAAVSLFVAHYNFCRVHESLRVTPAMELGLTGHVWSIGALVRAAEVALRSARWAAVRPVPCDRRRAVLKSLTNHDQRIGRALDQSARPGTSSKASRGCDGRHDSPAFASCVKAPFISCDL